MGLIRSLFLLPLLLALLGTTFAADTNRLNVLLIISDDLRCELGCYGSPIAKTPNLDRLAAAGVRFDRAYCQFPLCNPSRSSMLTGRQPSSTGILGNRGFFRDRHPDFISLPQLFQTNGYPTLRTGKIFHGGIDDTEAWTEGGERRGPAAEAGARDVLPANRAVGSSAFTRSGPPEGGTPNHLPRQRFMGSVREGWSSGRDTRDALMFAQYRVPNNRPGSADRDLTQAQRSDRWLILEGDGEGNPENASADRAIAFLRKYKDKPFFLACGFSKPHSPLTAPERFYDLYPVEAMPLPLDFAPRPTVPEGFPQMSIRPRNADLFIGRDATPQTARDMIRAYAASVSWMDWNVGRVIAELDRLGLREKTVIVFWGDNGYQLGERGKWSKAGSLFEQGCRIPLIVVAPGAKGNGKVCPRIVQSVDIYPTLAELCGLKSPNGLEGLSLAPLLSDPRAAWDHPAFSVWSEDGRTLHGVAVRTERWRYAEFGDGGKGGAMLFDEPADPNELKNLAEDPKLASVRAELSALVKAYSGGKRDL